MLFYLLICILWYYTPIMRDTIKKHIDFLPNDADLSARCAFFFVRARPAKVPESPRYGLIAAKRTFKLAVHRNRAKRLLRDWIRHNERYMCNTLDYIFVARHGILNASRPDGYAAMRKALNYIKKLNAEKSQE